MLNLWKAWCASPIPGINNSHLDLVKNFQKMNAVSVPWSHPRTTRQASVKNALQSEKWPRGFFCCCYCCSAKWKANYALNISRKKNLPLIPCLIRFHQNVILSGCVLSGTYQKPLLSMLFLLWTHSFNLSQYDWFVLKYWKGCWVSDW